MKRETRMLGIETLKTVFLFVLIVLMLVMLLLLMLGQRSADEEALLPKERMVVYSTGASTGYARGMNPARVLPAMLNYKEAGKPMKCLYAVDSMQKPYAALYDLIRLLFGADSVCSEYSRNAGEALWKTCAQSDAFLYVQYQNELPPSVIRAYTFSEETSETDTADLDAYAQGDTVYAKEVFFVPLSVLSSDGQQPDGQASDILCAVTRDNKGTVAVFRSAENDPWDVQDNLNRNETEESDAASSDTGIPDAYAAKASLFFGNDGNGAKENALSAFWQTVTLTDYLSTVDSLSTGAQNAVFTHDTDGILYQSENPSAVYCTGIYRMPVLYIEPWNPENKLFSGKNDTLNAVLSLFSLDENDAENYYTDTQGSRVYFNADGRLTFFKNGEIRYAALQNGGFPISEILGYASVDGSYLLSEYLRAADSLLDALAEIDNAFRGGDMQPALYEVCSTGGESSGSLSVSYIYTMKGIPVTAADGSPLTALKLTFSGGTISALALYPYCAGREGTSYFGAGEENLYLLPQDVVLRAMQAELALSKSADGKAEDVPVSVMDPDAEDDAALSFEDDGAEKEGTTQTEMHGSLLMRYMRDPNNSARAIAEWVFVAD